MVVAMPGRAWGDTEDVGTPQSLSKQSYSKPPMYPETRAMLLI